MYDINTDKTQNMSIKVEEKKQQSIGFRSIVERQREFFRSGLSKEIRFRKKQLKKLKACLKAHESDLYEAIYKDFKKSEFDTYTTELALVYSDINEAIKKVSRWSKKKSVGTNMLNFPAKSYILPEPLGVSLVIGAWNYPYQLSLAPVIAAMAAGCTIVLKPSEIPTHTSAIMATIIGEAFDPAYFTVVEGAVAETNTLLEEKFDKIFFTGSPRVGRIIYQAAARHLTPVTLELGGKSPAFITESCNLKMTARRLVWAKFLNAGQTCIAPDYLLVHKDIKQAFLDAIIHEIEASHFSYENGNYVQIINDKNLQRLVNYLDKEKIYYGGQWDEESRYLEPTIMTDVTFDDKVMEEEIFGPILPIIDYDDLSQAINMVNKLPRPLSCYVFTSQKELKNRVLQEISFGGGAVNEAVMHITNPKLPFGGVGNSGIGNYHGEAGFKVFTHYKSILDKPTWLELGLKYFPHSLKKLKLIRWIME